MAVTTFEQLRVYLSKVAKEVSEFKLNSTTETLQFLDVHRKVEMNSEPIISMQCINEIKSSHMIRTSTERQMISGKDYIVELGFSIDTLTIQFNAIAQTKDEAESLASQVYSFIRNRANTFLIQQNVGLDYANTTMTDRTNYLEPQYLYQYSFDVNFNVKRDEKKYRIPCTNLEWEVNYEN